MEGKIIVLLIVILIGVLIIYLLQDSSLLKELKGIKKNIKSSVEGIKKNREVELANRPVIYYRMEEEESYHSVSMNKKKFRIGRSKKNELILNSMTIEECHAVIYMRYKNNRIYFELVNTGKVNPVEYFNKQEEKYEYLGYKEGVELEMRNAFYVGDIKMIITVPTSLHIPTATERIEREVTDNRKRSVVRVNSERMIQMDEINI